MHAEEAIFRVGAYPPSIDESHQRPGKTEFQTLASLDARPLLRTEIVLSHIAWVSIEQVCSR
jgi:hypothetical protein